MNEQKIFGFGVWLGYVIVFAVTGTLFWCAVTTSNSALAMTSCILGFVQLFLSIGHVIRTLPKR